MSQGLDTDHCENYTPVVKWKRAKEKEDYYRKYAKHYKNELKQLK
jgi:hypothetical protein